MPNQRQTDPAIVAEVRRLLVEQGVTQYVLRQAGLGGKSIQILLGLIEGTPSVWSLEIALGTLTPPRHLWHVKKP